MKAKLTLLFLNVILLGYSHDFTKFDRSTFYNSTFNIYTVFVDKQDNVYAGTSTQLFRYNGVKWDSLTLAFNLPGSVKAIAQDLTDSIRFGVINNGIYSTWDLISYNPNSPPLANSWVNVMAVDAAGKIWAGTNSGVSVIDAGTVTNYTSSNGLLGTSVNDIKIAANGTVYVATALGVSIYKNSTWSYLTVDSGLVSNNIKSIEIDGNGHLWFGAYSNGISKYDGENWITYNEANTSGALLNYGEVGDLLWDGSTMWVAGFYIARCDNNVWKKYNGYSEGGPIFPQRLAVDSKNNIWISSLTAITKYNKSAESSIVETKSNNLQIYPNPAKDYIYLSTPVSKAKVSIYNMAGILEKSFDLSGQSIDVSALKKKHIYLK